MWLLLLTPQDALQLDDKAEGAGDGDHEHSEGDDEDGSDIDDLDDYINKLHAGDWRSSAGPRCIIAAACLCLG